MRIPIGTTNVTERIAVGDFVRVVNPDMLPLHIPHVRVLLNDADGDIKLEIGPYSRMETDFNPMYASLPYTNYPNKDVVRERVQSVLSAQPHDEYESHVSVVEPPFRRISLSDEESSSDEELGALNHDAMPVVISRRARTPVYSPVIGSQDAQLNQEARFVKLVIGNDWGKKRRLSNSDAEMLKRIIPALDEPMHTRSTCNKRLLDAVAIAQKMY